MARAYAVAGNKKLAKDHLNTARRLLDNLRIDDEDREIYLSQILDTEKMISRESR